MTDLHSCCLLQFKQEQLCHPVYIMEEYTKPMLCKVCNKACSVVAAKEM